MAPESEIVHILRWTHLIKSLKSFDPYISPSSLASHYRRTLHKLDGYLEEILQSLPQQLDGPKVLEWTEKVLTLQDEAHALIHKTHQYQPHAKSPMETQRSHRRLSSTPSSSSKVSNVDNINTPKSARKFLLNFPCKACERGHALRRCPVFKNMTLDDRWKIVNERKLCSNCFASTHSLKNCSSSHTCLHCGGVHNSSLHRFGTVPDAMKNQPAPRDRRCSQSKAGESGMNSEHISSPSEPSHLQTTYIADFSNMSSMEEPDDYPLDYQLTKEVFSYIDLKTLSDLTMKGLPNECRSFIARYNFYNGNTIQPRKASPQTRLLDLSNISEEGT